MDQDSTNLEKDVVEIKQDVRTVKNIMLFFLICKIIEFIIIFWILASGFSAAFRF